MKIFAETNALGTYAAALTEAESQLFEWLIWGSLGAAVFGLAAGWLVRMRIKQLDSKTAEQDER